jgi:hypothetical protein
MREVYDRHGITFHYPADWEVSEQEQGDECLITVSGPGTSFWSVGLFRDRPSPDLVLETALAAFKDEYPDLDSYEADDELLSQPTLGYDIEFFCLELVNTARIRSFLAQDFTVLVLCQADDTELETSNRLFEEMSRSLDCELADDDDDHPFDDLELPS